jgi:tetraacyldisaccharide 4'-kinase
VSRGAQASILAAPAAVYGLAIRARNRWYDRPSAVRRASIPVISIGNLAVGGTGKTPLVAWLASRLQGARQVPAVVSRGYGGTAGRGPVIVSTGGGPTVDARLSGDEPFQLARALPEAIVVVGSDRIAGVRAAAAAGATVALLDDGFQHRRLWRDLDVVVLDGRAPFANGHLLPAGPLREPASSLRRADLVVLTRLKEGDTANRAIGLVREAGFTGPVARAGHRRAGFVTSSGGPADPPARALAFCGIGDPASFREDLVAGGTALVGFEAFRDHHPFDAATWRGLLDRARSAAVTLVTTEKDLARLSSLGEPLLAGAPLLALRIEACVWDEEVVSAAVRQAIDPGTVGTP